MPRRTCTLLAGALALAGLALSAALLVDALRPAPAFCGAGGCAEVRASAWSRPLGVPLPVFGLAFFAGALALGATAATRARRALALAGAVGAAGLLAVQGLAIGAWCRLCVATDLVAILHAAAVLAAGRAPQPVSRGRRLLTAAAGLVAIAAPFAALRSQPPAPAPAVAALPDVVARAQVAGTAVVVDFVDFECPFCRAFHRRLEQAIARAAVPVKVVRVMVPLAQHERALPAAFAWCCAEAQGKGDRMAERLLAAADLGPPALERIAAELGVDLARADPAAVRARLAADAAAAEAAAVRALPTVYIGRERFVGAAATVDDLVAALRRAAG